MVRDSDLLWLEPQIELMIAGHPVLRHLDRDEIRAAAHRAAHSALSGIRDSDYSAAIVKKVEDDELRS